MHARSLLVVIVVSTALAGTRHAHAQASAPPYPPIEDRDYALDLYSGTVVGSVRMIGMGGASVAMAEGSVGTLSNAAGPAVRRTTRSGTFAYDFHLDGESSANARDFDNNGLPDTDESSSKLATFGLVIQYGPWGVGLVATTSSTKIVEDDADAEMGGVIEPQGSVAKLIVARSFGHDELTVGAGLRFASLSLVRPRVGLDDFVMLQISGPTAEAGALWRPPKGHLRVGVNGALPVLGTSVSVKECDPLHCEGYILPARVEAPWTVAAGVAYRFSHRPWNVSIDDYYRDERSVTLAADLVVTGGVPDGHGLEAFARHMLQPSGRHVVVSPRLGAEIEPLAGWIRVRVGTYYEPARVEAVSGRVHGTAGLDLRLFGFELWGGHYRPQISFTGDAASGYGNTGVSFGLWN
jgi:hypothetical protein